MAERTSLTTYRNSDLKVTYQFPNGYNMDGFSPVFYFRSAPGEAPLLTVTASPSVNGSEAVTRGDTVVLTLKSADLAVFGTEDIYNGVYDSNLPKDGFVNKFVGGPHTQYIDGSYGDEVFSDSVFVEIGGREVPVILESGNIGVASSVLLADLNAAVLAAEAAETAAETAAAEAVMATVNKLDLNGSNVGGNAATLRSNIGAVGSVALAAGTGGALVGTLDAGTGAVTRTLAAWLQDLPALPKGYGAVINGATDDTTALNNALATGRQVYITGRMYINGVVNLPDKFEIVGAGPEQAVIALGPLGQLKMTGASYSSRIGFGSFKDIGIAMVDSITSVSTPSVLIEKTEQVTFDNCIFYHTLTRLDATAGIAFSRCRFFGGITGSQLVSQTSYQPGGGQGISEYPTFTDCDFSGHPVDLIDTVNATFHICRMLAGAYGIKSRRLNATGSGGQEFYMGPVIDLCTFDSIDGLAIDIEYGGTTSRITNSFISAGRVGGVSGVRLDHCVGFPITGNRFEWCGVRAIVGTACQGISVTGNQFVNQAAGAAVWFAGASSGLCITGNVFLNTPLWGGSGSGATTLAIETPASDLSNSVISGNYISGMTDGSVAYVAGTNNQIFGNMGWNYGGYLNEVGLRLNTNQVVGVRNTGWTAATGTGSKGAFAATAAGTANAAYVQADFQTALNRVAALEARVKSYDDMLFTHGLIGT